MRSMFFLTLVIVLVSGLIAYIGDLIGRKMGRKRLSLLGLRPRYTAIVISIGIGMLIAALTLTATFAIDKRVRDAFFTPIERLRGELQTRNAQISDAEAQLQTKTQLLKGTEDKRLAIQHQLADVQGSLRAKQTSLDKVNQQLAKARTEYHAIEAQFRDTKQKLASANTDLTHARQIMIDYSKQILDSQKKVMRLEAEQADLQAAIGELALTNFAPLTFQQGEEILSGLFPTAASESSLQQMLTKFFAVANRVVRERSPKMSVEDSAMLFYRMPAVSTERLVALMPGEAINVLIARIKSEKSADRVLVQLVPANNVRVNGPAMIIVDNLSIVPNKEVFAAGSEVAKLEMEITPKTDQADILGKLVDELLRVDVPEAMRKKKMPMITRRFDPSSPDRLPSETLSMVKWSYLLDTTEKVQGYRGKVVIMARTQTALHLFDPLALKLDVSPVKP